VLFMTLAEMLKGTQVLFLDGAMGTQLAARGLGEGGLQNLVNPEDVCSIHEDYVRAGAQILITNTLTMNRISMEAYGRGDDFVAANQAGVALARNAANGRVVLGDISSTGRLLEPYGDANESDLAKCFSEQASLLSQSGVEGIIIETMIDLREAVCALKACRKATSLPVFVTLSFSSMKDGGRTVMGDKAEECAAALTNEGADAIGVNCGNLDPFEVSKVIARFRENTHLPLIAQPNAGKPRVVEGRTVFDLSPEEFAQGLMECVKSGARFIGGCCGTSPAHIKAAFDLCRAV